MQLTERPQKLQLVENEIYPTNRLTNEQTTDNVITMNNMSQMAQYVYSMYVDKLDTIKDKLPKESDTEMYADIPQEEDPKKIDQMEVEEPEDELASMTIYEPPAKKVTPDVPAKDKTTSATKAFKPTPIVNEIDDVEEEPEAEAVAEPETEQNDGNETSNNEKE